MRKNIVIAIAGIALLFAVPLVAAEFGTEDAEAVTLHDYLEDWRQGERLKREQQRGSHRPPRQQADGNRQGPIHLARTSLLMEALPRSIAEDGHGRYGITARCQ